MEIGYGSRSIEKICTDATVAEKKYGLEMAEKIQLRVEQICAAESVEMMVQCHIGRCHQLKGKRKEQWAVDLVHPYRLVFTKIGEEIEIACIQEIVDYH